MLTTHSLPQARAQDENFAWLPEPLRRLTVRLARWLLCKLQGAIGMMPDFVVPRLDPKSVEDALRLLQPTTNGHQLVRIGGVNDGGYLVPNDLEGITACYSPGVAHVADFEATLVGRGIRCFMLDASVEQSPLDHPLASFERRFVGVQSDGELWVSLSDWVAEHSTGDTSLLLQMDIEGSEWGILSTTPEDVLTQFRIIVLELHDLHLLGMRVSGEVILATLRRLKKHYDVLHVHANNYRLPVSVGKYRIPPVIEVTLHRKDRAIHSAATRQHGSPLDTPNCSWLSDVIWPVIH